MTTLHTILYLFGGISYIAVTIFACEAWTRLRRMDRRLHDIDRQTSNTLMLTMENHLKNSVDILNDMQRRLRILVEEEQYETAEQLRAAIESQAKNLRLQIEHMKKTFGDKVDFELHFVGEKNDNEND